MKVTVCFGAVRVLVPCGAGDLLVRDLVREATLRYKKATGQVSNSNFSILQLTKALKMSCEIDKYRSTLLIIKAFVRFRSV
ncbi:unnamed protein product [Leptosia nina]|uniref:Par3/HAL N-terminal domain-containing protein n=1 Tax=Leptosia nina TaxID=320188 RepID=A0AAV1J8U4_9NEOP